MTDDQIIDIWTGLKEYLDKKQLDVIASKYVDILADNGVSDETFKYALGHDDDLDQAIGYYLDEFPEEEIDFNDDDFIDED